MAPRPAVEAVPVQRVRDALPAQPRATCRDGLLAERWMDGWMVDININVIVIVCLFSKFLNFPFPLLT